MRQSIKKFPCFDCENYLKINNLASLRVSVIFGGGCLGGIVTRQLNTK